MATRNDFVIKDLAISIRPEMAGGAGGTWMPVDDGPPLPWWISPIAAVLDKGRLLDPARRVIVDSIKDKVELDSVIAAFDGDPDGSPAIRHAIHEIGAAVVAAAAYQPIGGEVGYIDPNCGGTSYETIPPTITPIVHRGFEVHRISELPRLRRQLEIAVETLDKVASGLEPRGEELETLNKQLEGMGRGG